MSGNWLTFAGTLKTKLMETVAIICLSIYWAAATVVAIVIYLRLSAKIYDKDKELRSARLGLSYKTNLINALADQLKQRTDELASLKADDAHSLLQEKETATNEADQIIFDMARMKQRIDFHINGIEMIKAALKK